MQTTKIFNAGERKLRTIRRKNLVTLFCPTGCSMPSVNAFITGEYLDGSVVVVGNKAYILISGVWKSVSNIYTIVGGVWKEVDVVYVLNGGAWKQTV